MAGKLQSATRACRLSWKHKTTTVKMKSWKSINLTPSHADLFSRKAHRIHRFYFRNYAKNSIFNSLWPSDATWHHRSGSTSVHWLMQWLVAWWNQAFTWTSVNFSIVMFCDIHLRAISQRVPKLLSCMSLKITLLKLLPPHLPGANELNINMTRKKLRILSQLVWSWHHIS